MTVDFEIEGQKYVGSNGGPSSNLTKPFRSKCIARKHKRKWTIIFEKLSESGNQKAQQCGWLKDKYGVSWQIVPVVLTKMLQDKDAKKSQRVMKALLQMRKLDIKTLTQAYEEK